MDALSLRINSQNPSPTTEFAERLRDAEASHLYRLKQAQEMIDEVMVAIKAPKSSPSIPAPCAR